ncbi:hypothetical protein ACFPRL_04495 [Pseudoclavibacter helvolus]
MFEVGDEGSPFGVHDAPVRFLSAHLTDATVSMTWLRASRR